MDVTTFFLSQFVEEGLVCEKTFETKEKLFDANEKKWFKEL